MADSLKTKVSAVVAALIFFFCFFPLRAEATPPPRVIVGDFRGPQSVSLRTALVQNLEEEQSVVVIPDNNVSAAKKKLKIGKSVKKNQYQSLFQGLGANAHVSGSVRKKRRGWSLTLRVRNSQGEVVGSKTWSGRTFASLRGVRRSAFKRLSPVFAEAAGASPSSPQGPHSGGSSVVLAKPGKTGKKPQPGTSKPKPPAQGTSKPPAQGAGPATAPPKQGGQQVVLGNQASGAQQSGAPPGAGQPNAGQPGSGQPGAEGGQNGAWYAGKEEPNPVKAEEPAKVAESGPQGIDRLEALTLGLSFGLLKRSFGSQVGVFARYRSDPVNPTASDDTRIINEDRSYVGGRAGHTEIGISGEMYPGLFFKKPVVPYLGLTFEFRNAVGLATDGPSCNKNNSPTPDACPETQETISIGTTQREIGVGLRGRYRFGEKQRSPRVWADIGWGVFSFVLNTEDLKRVDRSTIIPPMTYNYINLGGGASYGLVPNYLTLGVNFAYRLGLAQNVDTRRVWGTETGKSNGLLVGIELRSEAPYFFEGAFWGLEFDFFRFTTTFAGQPQCQAEPEQCGGETNTPQLWEPWPYDGVLSNENQSIAEGGGVLGSVADTYYRIGLKFGYSYR